MRVNARQLAARPACTREPRRGSGAVGLGPTGGGWVRGRALGWCGGVRDRSIPRKRQVAARAFFRERANRTGGCLGRVLEGRCRGLRDAHSEISTGRQTPGAPPLPGPAATLKSRKSSSSRGRLGREGGSRNGGCVFPPPLCRHRARLRRVVVIAAVAATAATTAIADDAGTTDRTQSSAHRGAITHGSFDQKHARTP